jgi:hypothetical protein
MTDHGSVVPLNQPADVYELPVLSNTAAAPRESSLQPHARGPGPHSLHTGRPVPDAGFTQHAPRPYAPADSPQSMAYPMMPWGAWPSPVASPQYFGGFGFSWSQHAMRLTPPAPMPPAVAGAPNARARNAYVLSSGGISTSMRVSAQGSLACIFVP